MELKHIDIANISVSTANMLEVTKKPDLTNILPSVRARGILVPLIVRPGAEDGSYEIIAGKRADRFVESWRELEQRRGDLQRDAIIAAPGSCPNR